jgi:hypothetical protein
MANRFKTNGEHHFDPATFLGPKPGDYPVGSLQSRAAARAMVASYAEQKRRIQEDWLGNLTPVERALIEGQEPGVQIWMVRLYRNAQHRSKVYGTTLPRFTPAQIRHNRAVNEEIQQMISGSLFSAQNDSDRWNKLKAIAEANLRAKKK